VKNDNQFEEMNANFRKIDDAIKEKDPVVLCPSLQPDKYLRGGVGGGGGGGGGDGKENHILPGDLQEDLGLHYAMNASTVRDPYSPGRFENCAAITTVAVHGLLTSCTTSATTAAT